MQYLEIKVRFLKVGLMDAKSTRLVYSSDPKLNEKCPRCKEVLSECTCPLPDDPKTYKFVAVLRLEKAGRGGKTVTVIDQLPKNDPFLKDLTTQLKKKCGSGGTYSLTQKEGIIEIQGDQRETVRNFLKQKNISTKG